ncbi:MAG: serine/threonine protein phosphatase, partial [Streptomyces sp.]
MVEGSMTQGAGQGPDVRTATLRDFRVPAYVHETGPVQGDPAGVAVPGAPG